MNTVQEQITALRNWRESDCMGAQCIDEREDAADTLESMQARIELLEKAVNEAWGQSNHGSMQCMLCADVNETLSEVLKAQA